VRAVRAFARLGDVEMEMLSRAVFIGTVGILVAYFFATNIYEKQLWLLIALGLALPNIARRAAASAGRDDGGEDVGDAGRSRVALPSSVRTRSEVVPWRR
jgi:hypothetical protein